MSCWTVWEAAKAAASSGASAVRHPVQAHHVIGKRARHWMRHEWNVRHRTAHFIWKSSVACAGLVGMGGTGLAGWHYVPPIASAAWGALGSEWAACCGGASGPDYLNNAVGAWRYASIPSGASIPGAPVQVPEPASLLLFGFALAVLVTIRGRVVSRDHAYALVGPFESYAKLRLWGEYDHIQLMTFCDAHTKKRTAMVSGRRGGSRGWWKLFGTAGGHGVSP